MILADTSVWIEHFRHGESRLRDALEAAEVLVHPYVIGELACGNLRARESILGLLRRLPHAPLASDAEAHVMIERHRLMGRGIGWIDAHLLASTALLPSTTIWTRDRRLAEVARAIGLGN